MPVVFHSEVSHSPTASFHIEILAIRGIWKISSCVELECGTTPAGRRKSSSSRREVFDGPLSGQSVYEQTSGVLPAHWNRTGGRRWSKSRAPHPPAHAATSLHSFTRFQPGHQPENWRALQKEDTAHESVSLSSGTSGRCSCRNFGTCLHYNSNASSGPVRRDGLFWDFGSLFQKASRCQTASCCGSSRAVSEKTLRRPSSRLLRQRKLGNGPLRSQSCASRRVHLCPGVQIRKDCAQLSVQLRLCLLGGL